MSFVGIGALKAIPYLNPSIKCCQYFLHFSSDLETNSVQEVSTGFVYVTLSFVNIITAKVILYLEG